MLVADSLDLQIPYPYQRAPFPCRHLKNLASPLTKAPSRPKNDLLHTSQALPTTL